MALATPSLKSGVVFRLLFNTTPESGTVCYKMVTRSACHSLTFFSSYEEKSAPYC